MAAMISAAWAKQVCTLCGSNTLCQVPLARHLFKPTSHHRPRHGSAAAAGVGLFTSPVPSSGQPAAACKPAIRAAGLSVAHRTYGPAPAGCVCSGSAAALTAAAGAPPTGKGDSSFCRVGCPAAKPKLPARPCHDLLGPQHRTRGARQLCTLRTMQPPPPLPSTAQQSPHTSASWSKQRWLLPTTHAPHRL